MISIEQLLVYFNAGLMTRSELVSALAEREPAPLDDEQLAKDVDALRERMKAGDTFVIKSTC